MRKRLSAAECEVIDAIRRAQSAERNAIFYAMGGRRGPQPHLDRPDALRMLLDNAKRCRAMAHAYLDTLIDRSP